MTALRFLRSQPAMLLLLLAPIMVFVTLTLVGPGASEQLASSSTSAPTTTSTTVAAAAAGTTPLATDPPVDTESGFLDESADGGSSGRASASSSGSGGSTGVLGASATPTSNPTSNAAASEVPPSAVVSESSSPIVQIIVACGVVAVAVGGYALWRRGRQTR